MKYRNTIPLPPPLSALTNNVKGRGRVKSKRYTEWIKLVTPYAYLTRRSTLTGDVRAVYAMGKPSKARMDVANREKAVSDLLTSWGILSDDSQIIDIRLYWSKDVEPGMVTVELEPVC